MAEKSAEQLIEYKKRVLDSKSPSFCGAKWFASSIWLGTGQTSSCHLPPPHLIDLKAIEEDPSALHNTATKKKFREQMLNGEFPSECEYCWKFEALGPEFISDRVLKTRQFREQDLAQVFQQKLDVAPKLLNLEIAFDRVCQMMCSYCSPTLSSSWAREIKRNGIFENLRSDAAGHFQKDADSDYAFSSEQNPYIKAFWKWWPELRASLQVLRVTGGEPLLSPDFWKLFEKIENEKMKDPNFILAVNSNFVVQSNLIDKFIEKSHAVGRMRLFTSAEAYGAQAEYIRKGLDYSIWKKNVVRAGKEANLDSIYLMMTINALCLFSLPEFLDDMMGIKSLFRPGFFNLSLNILRFPSFQSPLVLSASLRSELSKKLAFWCERNFSSAFLMESEKASLRRLIEFLIRADTPHALASPTNVLKSDFQSFYFQYDQRCGFDIRKIFGPEFTNWYDEKS